MTGVPKTRRLARLGRVPSVVKPGATFGDPVGSWPTRSSTVVITPGSRSANECPRRIEKHDARAVGASR